MSTKKRLQEGIFNLLKHNKHGSFKTQANRRSDLMSAMQLLADGGYHLKYVRNINGKHIRYLLDQWQDLSVGTQKNKASALRWLCEQIGQPALMKKSNAELGIEKRCNVTNIDRSLRVKDTQWQKISEPRVLISLQLQRVFGLRKSESMKIQPCQADKEDYLALKGSWCKGGRPRKVLIRTDEQRYWLDKAKQLLEYKTQSLIPADKTYVSYMKNTYDKALSEAGIQKAHGLRHAYAQGRYEELTGWACPVKGGLFYNQMSRAQQLLDTEIRLRISEELGHSRMDIVSQYVGGRQSPN